MVRIPINRNEPVVHPLVRKSFVFVPSVGMRLSPEVIVLELFREVFFKSHSESSATRDLDPEDMHEDKTMAYLPEEQAVLYALRGRRKKTKYSKAQRFFAPAYPVLARSSWLGKKRERVIKYLLLGGPIAQYLWHRGTDVEEKQYERDETVNLICTALIGHNSYKEGEYRGKDILSVALKNTVYDNYEQARQNLLELTSYSNSVIRITHDEIATRIFKDVRFLCQLEKDLPRMQWMHVLMTYLRFALPMWLLAQMRITNLLHGWLIDAIDNKNVVDTYSIVEQISFRNRALLNLTLTSTREVFDRIEQYMRHRVELNVFLYYLQAIRKEDIEGKELDITGGSAGKIGVEELLEIARNSSEEFQAAFTHGLDVRRFLTRKGELYPAWRNPLKKGQGKNIDEFLRVMYRDEIGDESGGYLLIPEGKGATRGFRVFPGQLLIKTITYLAAQDKHLDSMRGGGGKLVLGDVESHFHQYGVDFSNAVDARLMLMEEMKALGLLTGSPDAGSSVAVSCPY